LQTRCYFHMSCFDAWHRAGLANAGTYLFWPRNRRSFFHLLPTTPESACARNATLTQSLRRLVWKFSSPDRPRAMTHACRPGHVFRVVSERPDRKQIMQVIAGGPASGRHRFTLSESGAIAGFLKLISGQVCGMLFTVSGCTNLAVCINACAARISRQDYLTTTRD
jgi:hypothetical protein